MKKEKAKIISIVNKMERYLQCGRWYGDNQKWQELDAIISEIRDYLVDGENITEDQVDDY